MKYIMIECNESGCIRNMPIIFPQQLVHADVFNSLRELFPYKEDVGINVVSAGEINFFGSEFSCGGSSETLKVESRGEIDERIIRMFNYQHGIVF